MYPVHRFAWKLGEQLAGSKEPVYRYNGLLIEGHNQYLLASFIVTIAGITADIWLSIPDIDFPSFYLREPGKQVLCATCMEKLHADFTAALSFINMVNG